jgi:hypothetical protein
MAHEDSIPIEARLEQLILGEGSDLFWVPKPKNNFEMDATLELAKALRSYERAFGLENTIQQLDLLRATARTLFRKNAAQTRMIEARREINAEAAAARAAGNEVLARSIEDRPTPDYPERESDELELGYYVK